MKALKPSHSVIGIILFLLISSVALNVVLYLKAQNFLQDRNFYYLKLSKILLDPDPLKLSFYSEKNKQLDLTSSTLPVVVFFGDSRAYHWVLPSNIHGFLLINRGIGGQTSADVMDRFAYDIKPLKPNVIILQVGINDLTNIPIFFLQKQIIIDNCKANISKIVSESQSIGSTVILTTIFPLGRLPHDQMSFWSDVITAINDVNDYIRSLGGERVIIFDTTQALADDQGLVKREYSQDVIHLNDSGYRVLNAELEKVLGRIHL
ncbi:MAG TPA: GDSL-type esterase/lipase family protein [Thermodesulfobacteriota bacterium]|nr:GDSL-type esterase/lipase family protein [Thermodesulfobacteriota bacterium]